MAAQEPIYQAYTVIKREGQDDFWLNIGAAFAHADGNGYNVLLQALPINGKLVLRPPKAQSDEPAERPAKDNNKRRTEIPPRKVIDRTLEYGNGTKSALCQAHLKQCHWHCPLR